MVSETETGDQSDWHDKLRQFLRASSSKYADRRAVLLQIRHTIQSDIAEALQPAMNEHLRSAPHETYEEKQALATWVNRELHEIGLTIRCPKTGWPSILVADVRGSGHDAQGRFRIEARDEQGKTMRTYSSTRLPELDLMEEPPRRENFASRSRIPPDLRGR